jgi:hypothetical protein
MRERQKTDKKRDKEMSERWKNNLRGTYNGDREIE